MTCNPKLEQILTKYRGHKGVLIPVLQEIQRLFGYISEESITAAAKGLGLPQSEVLRVVRLYSQFKLEPKGKNMIRICGGPACYIRGADRIAEAFARELGIKPNEVTGDKNFSLEWVACLDTCELAPAAMIGEQIYGPLTPEKVSEILSDYK